MSEILLSEESLYLWEMAWFSGYCVSLDLKVEILSPGWWCTHVLFLGRILYSHGTSLYHGNKEIALGTT